MPLSAEERDLLKSVYQRLDNRPLPPGDPLYQHIYEHPGCDDPVDLLETHILWNEVENVQMFSGFRGSGKSTELLRLKKRLEDQGCVVLYRDALDYLNPSEPIEIADLLIVVAGAFSDALNEDLNIDLAGEAYWNRFFNYLKNTELLLPEVAIKAEGETPGKSLLGGLKAGVDLKLALKTTPSFRQQLQQFLSSRLGELTMNVHQFIEDGVRRIRKEKGTDCRIVFLFDSLEQIRGSLSSEQDVIRSVERLFASHLQKLDMPYVHMVYTVPPWLQFVMPGAVKIVMIPSIRQWNNDPSRSEYTPGWNALRSLVSKRLGKAECTHFFGKPNAHGHYPTADRIIGVCGGHFRDLLLLLRETLLRTKSLPITEPVVDAAISSVRSTFLPIAIEDARWLDQIAKLRTSALPSTRPEDANRLTRFLDTHFVLYMANGTEWYDVHPLIREEVAQISAQHAPATLPETQAG